jgi:hypothetical protein
MRKPKFEIRFDGTLQCHVKPAARAKALKKCIADGEQAIDLEVSAAGGGMYMFSRYPDQLPKGLMTFTWTGDHLTIVQGVLANGGLCLRCRGGFHRGR